MKRIDQLIGSYDCLMALQLCQHALVLCAQKQCKEVADVCSFVSTLCVKQHVPSCQEETRLCISRVKACEDNDCEVARQACTQARTICLKNYEIQGS